MTGSLRHAARGGVGRRPAHACCSQIRQWIGRRATATCGASGPGSSSSRTSSRRISTARLGPEPLGPLSAARLGERLEGRRAPLKSALLDQRTVAGLGNIYVDEALWQSRLHPLRVAGSLDARRARPAAPGGPQRPAQGDRAPGLDAARLRATRRRATARCRTSSAPTDVGGEPCDRCGTAARPHRRRRAHDDVLPALPDSAADDAGATLRGRFSSRAPAITLAAPRPNRRAVYAASRSASRPERSRATSSS